MTPLQPLIKWYLANKRDLPWRNNLNPYHIWLSEIILQQTRVEQGLPYYLKFIEHYPTIKHLAEADDNNVMKLWQGLGYYNRASNMLKTARILVSSYNGVFPETYAELLNLKGIGPYTAAAISSFAFNEAQAVVDGNVYRVLARLFAIDEPIYSTSGKKLFATLAQDLLNLDAPALHNQAIMELGAMVCKPKLALCQACVLRLQCQAYAQKRVYDFPV
ncbi:MAG: A/G-specific adenine glycosylase, partial [Bacteroidia bacterium]|nr:A/G-specific adenine glycosylase [Bacteroidia bacterium]